MNGFVAACLTSYNEADIIGDTIRHLFSQGIEQVLVADGMSTDGTRDILTDLRRETGAVLVLDDRDDRHYQPKWMNRLAGMAREAGARWVVAADCDEMWCGSDGRTVAEVLESVQPGVTKVWATMWQYVDREYREPGPKPLRKVAYRAFPWALVRNGNHSVELVGAGADGLHVREIQFRGFEHFCRKIRERCERLDPSLPATEGTHMTQYRGWSPEQLRPVWDVMVARATVYDPIPAGVRA